MLREQQNVTKNIKQMNAFHTFQIILNEHIVPGNFHAHPMEELRRYR